MSWAKPRVSITVSSHHENDESWLKNHDRNTTDNSRPFEELTKETPKSHSRKRPAESEFDKENVPIDGGHEVHKPPVKRLALGMDNTKSRTKKTCTAVRTKKKKPALLEGQKQLTLFFR